jgi:putative membrane protein
VRENELSFLFMRTFSKHLILLGLVGAVLIWSGIHPHDYFTWLLEIAPALIAFIFLAVTYRRFPLSDLSYFLIAIHSIILMIGGHYTYAEVPLFNHLRDIGWFARNNYDKIGHFAQGFIPALVVREILLRCSPVKRGKWLALFVVSICLAASACYELIEWGVSVGTGSVGDAFLGTQGYVWDTQSDMLCALLGALCALLFLGSIHDRFLKKMKEMNQTGKVGS